MEQPSEIEFNVDEQYENEKGVFKVVSIHKDQMVIRWEDGEEARTDIELQRRIAERRQWEERKRLADRESAEGARRKSASKAPKPVFAGLAATDFKTSISRTTWRSRYQLGGAVIQKISPDQFQFNSWAVGSQPEMHVQDIKHHKTDHPAHQTTFFVRIDQQALYYGLRVVRPANGDGALAGCPALREWLTSEENEQAVLAIADEYKLSACNRARPSVCIKTASGGGGWCVAEAPPSSSEMPLAAFFDKTPPEAPLEFELFATLPKDDAVAAGTDIASRIAQLFTALLPLYKTAATP